MGYRKISDMIYKFKIYMMFAFSTVFPKVKTISNLIGLSLPRARLQARLPNRVPARPDAHRALQGRHLEAQLQISSSIFRLQMDAKPAPPPMPPAGAGGEATGGERGGLILMAVGGGVTGLMRVCLMLAG